MKTLLFILISYCCSAQQEVKFSRGSETKYPTSAKSIFNNQDTSKIPYFDTNAVTSITICYGLPVNDYLEYSAIDSSISIVGDTMKVVRMLVDEIHRLNKKQSESELLEYAAINFANQVPDYYKTKAHNCRWEEYYTLLKNKGFYKTKATVKKCTCN